MAATRRFRPAALATLVVLVLAGAMVVAVPARAGDAEAAAGPQERWAFCKINDERRARGLAPYAWDANLSGTARRWSGRMATANHMSHDPNVELAYSSASPSWRYGSENVGYASTGVQLHGLFMDSPGHRANILRSGSNRAGVGAVVTPEGRVWITHRFLEGPPLPNPDVCPEGAAATPAAQPGAAPLAPGSYVDVDPRLYYADAIRWAGQRGITTGCAFNTFCPSDWVNRGQIALFLWRMAGQPSVLGGLLGFLDVTLQSVYGQAVTWLRSIGLSSGCGANRYCPAASLTRAQLVTMLWRSAGAPAGGKHGFADVAQGAYHADAVAWAAAQGITSGTGAGRFSPDGTVTRGQAVTFLHRYAGSP